MDTFLVTGQVAFLFASETTHVTFELINGQMGSHVFSQTVLKVESSSANFTHVIEIL